MGTAGHLGTQPIFVIFKVFIPKLVLNTPHMHTNAHKMILDTMRHDHKVYLPNITSHKRKNELRHPLIRLNITSTVVTCLGVHTKLYTYILYMWSAKPNVQYLILFTKELQPDPSATTWVLHNISSLLDHVERISGSYCSTKLFLGMVKSQPPLMCNPLPTPCGFGATKN